MKGQFVYIVEFKDDVTKEAYNSLIDIFYFHTNNEIGTDLRSLYIKQNWKIDVQTDKCTIKRFPIITKKTHGKV